MIENSELIDRFLDPNKKDGFIECSDSNSFEIHFNLSSPFFSSISLRVMSNYTSRT